MFAIDNVSEQGFDKLILKDKSINTHVEILPACGAILHAFVVENSGVKLNIIDQYESAEDFTTNVTSGGFKSCKLSPFACRLKNASYSFDGNTYAVSKFFLGKNGHHGLIYDRPFVVTDQGCNNDNAFVTMKYEYRAEDKGFPFEYDCVVTYTLKKENELSITTLIFNRSNGSMPIQDGWHPYFTFGGTVNDLEFEFKCSNEVEFDEELIPSGNLIRYDKFNFLRKIGNTSFDNCYSLDFTEKQPLCILRDNGKRLQLEIHPRESYPYLQIYIPPHRNSIALENLSAVPDAFNNGMGLIVLEPSEKKSFTTTYKITSLI